MFQAPSIRKACPLSASQLLMVYGAADIIVHGFTARTKTSPSNIMLLMRITRAPIRISQRAVSFIKIHYRDIILLAFGRGHGLMADGLYGCTVSREDTSELPFSGCNRIGFVRIAAGSMQEYTLKYPISTPDRLRSSTTTYCEMLLWSREHRSSLTMYIPSIDQLPRWGSRVLTVSFPSPAATELMHDLRRKKIHYDFPCFVASFISLFILVGLGSQLLGG